jgi:hypothetical protein
MEHQEGAGEPRKCEQEGGEPIQLGVQDHLVFKFKSRLRTTSILDILHMHRNLRR